MNERKTAEISLGQCLRVLWKKVYWIVACAVLLALVGLLYTSQFVTTTYKTEATFYVNSVSYATDNDGNRVEVYNTVNLDAARSMVASCVVVLNSYTTLDAVIANAGLQEQDMITADMLKSMISASASGETEFLKITVVDSDPIRAKAIVDAMTGVVGQDGVLKNRVETTMEGTKLSVVDYARDAQAIPIGYFKNIAVSAAVGAILCAVVILIKEFMNPLITEDETVTNLFGLPVLAVIPNLCREADTKPYYSYAYKMQGSKRES